MNIEYGRNFKELWDPSGFAFGAFQALSGRSSSRVSVTITFNTKSDASIAPRPGFVTFDSSKYVIC